MSVQVLFDAGVPVLSVRELRRLVRGHRRPPRDFYLLDTGVLVDALPPPVPTEHAPLTAGKLLAFALRYRQRVGLFHVTDAPAEPDRRAGKHDANHDYRIGRRPRGTGSYRNGRKPA